MSDTLSVCGLTICRGSKLRTMLPVPGTEIEIPLTIINGAFDGPTLLVTAGIHGGEYPGIAAAMELGRSLDPQEIHGSLIMLHPVNIQGFWARREFIVPEDGKNLNRVFPGNPDGTLSEKTAGLISSSFFPLADFYVDLHSGDIHESLHPYVYYPGQPTEELAAKARSVAKVLNVEYMVRSMATGGAYNYAASTGLPSLLIERGGAGLCLHEDIEEYKSDLKNIMRKLGLLNEPVKPRRYIPRDVTDIIYLEAQETGGAYNYAASTGLPSLLIERGGAGLCLHEDIEEYKSDLKNIMRKLGLLNEPVKPRRYIPRDVTDIIYLEAQETGCWLHHIHSGDFVEEGQILGRTTDLFGETLTTYYAKQSGIVLYVCPALSAPQGTVLLAYGKIHNED